MPNDYFQFKQFRIEQGQAAMKVTTEACLFGSLIESEGVKHILDIGTGTGLLALMLAQKTEAKVDAIEINKEAFEQAEANFKSSPWADKLAVLHEDVRAFTADKKYDLIIANPPFFEKHQTGAKAGKNQALHNDSLSYKQLASSLNRHLRDHGKAWVLLPPYPMQQFIMEMAAFDLQLSTRIIIHNSPSKKHFREVACFQKKVDSISYSNINIRNGEGDYSDKFIELLKPYYLHL